MNKQASWLSTHEVFPNREQPVDYPKVYQEVRHNTDAQ